MKDTLKPGAIWHGPWDSGMIERTFGTSGQLHFSMTNGKIRNEKYCSTIQFFPFTSKKNRRALLILPPGTVPFGDKTKTSYLLNFRLLTTVEDLEIRFKYKTTLPSEIYEKFKKNYCQQLKNRKKKK